MISNAQGSEPDIWSEWLLHRRHAGDADHGRAVRASTAKYADRILDGARLGAGMTLLDVGSGEGLVAFRAIARMGPALRVILTDISVTMLRHAQTLAVEAGVQAQCEFVQGTAEQLSGIADASVDVVTTRSVLAYVPDKLAALREFYRVLKPGGSISLGEPVFRDEAMAACAMRTVLEAGSARDNFLPLLHRWKAAQFPDCEARIATDPMTNYTERDFVRYVKQTGFTSIHMEFHMDIGVRETSWEVFLGSSPHPLAPSLDTILAERFNTQERLCFEQTLRPALEAGQLSTTSRMAYVTATKPG